MYSESNFTHCPPITAFLVHDFERSHDSAPQKRWTPSPLLEAFAMDVLLPRNIFDSQ